MKSHGTRTKCRVKHLECLNDFVLLGPRRTVVFQGFENIYIRPTITTDVGLTSHLGDSFALFRDTTNDIDGVQVLRTGLYEVNISAYLEAFEDSAGTIRAPFQGTQDVRVFIDDMKLVFPPSPYGQTSNFADPVLLNLGQQSPSLGFSGELYLQAGQTITFGFLYAPSVPDLWYRLTLQWSAKASTGCCAPIDQSVPVLPRSTIIMPPRPTWTATIAAR